MPHSSGFSGSSSSRCALPPPEQLGEDLAEHAVDVFEAVGERRFHTRVQAADGVVKAAAGFVQVLGLRGEEVESLLGLLIFLDGVGVDAAHRADLRLEAGQPGGRLIHFVHGQAVLAGGGIGHFVLVPEACS